EQGSQPDPKGLCGSPDGGCNVRGLLMVDDSLNQVEIDLFHLVVDEDRHAMRQAVVELLHLKLLPGRFRQIAGKKRQDLRAGSRTPQEQRVADDRIAAAGVARQEG